MDSVFEGRPLLLGGLLDEVAVGLGEDGVGGEGGRGWLGVVVVEDEGFLLFLLAHGFWDLGIKNYFLGGGKRDFGSKIIRKWNGEMGEDLTEEEEVGSLIRFSKEKR